MTDNEFMIFPAIDLRQGRVVRLSEGDPNRQTRYSDQPAEIARAWLQAGAKWLHVINLDAALGEEDSLNRAALQEILQTAGEFEAKVQYGGGVRDLETAEQLLNLGVQRVILGTLAIRQPELVQQAIEKWGIDRVAVSLDARGSEVMVRGWQENSQTDIWTAAHHLKECGLRWLVYTDVSRDGMQTGFNLETTFDLAWQSGLDVIASGGVRSIEDVQAARQACLAGIILGRALYEGKLDLQDAIERYQYAG